MQADVVAPDRSAWLKGPCFACLTPSPWVEDPWRIVLLGPPGVGKGTQAERLRLYFKGCHLSTGDIFRTAKQLAPEDRSPAMVAALGYMSRGELVPDSTVLDVVRERMRCLCCGGGFLLDGFPRTVPQAEALEGMLSGRGRPLTAVIEYDLPIDAVVARVGGRRSCGACRAVFHVTHRPPRVPDVCDQCGGTLVCREDDRPETVRVRMEAYESATAPLAEFYASRGLLRRVVADGTPDQVFGRTLHALHAGPPGKMHMA